MSLYELFMIIISIFIPISMVVKLSLDWFSHRKSNERVREAEKQAFGDKPDELEKRLSELSQSQEGLEERTLELATLVEESRSSIVMGRLFNLYSKQIELYQDQTRSRATWSFLFAIAAMSAGLAFVVWGGTVLLSAEKAIVLAAGGIIAGTGGAVSAFITKTFLDVHRVSLDQLNRYFRQPVINDHILMAQRLAEECDDAETKKKAYDMIIASISGLIRGDEGNHLG